MTAAMTLSPYVRDAEKRSQIERLADEYCREKRSVQSTEHPGLMPDQRFTTDGCSRWFDASWVSCCVVHDIIYWCGGSDEDREEADRLMAQCANEKTPLMGNVMYPGVRLGGVPWLPTPWRWGYGWKEWPRGYEKPPQGQSVGAILQKLDIENNVKHQIKPK